MLLCEKLCATLCNNKTADSQILHDVARSFYTELHGDFFEVDCVEKRCSEAFYFFDLKELK